MLSGLESEPKRIIHSFLHGSEAGEGRVTPEYVAVNNGVSGTLSELTE